MGVDGAVIVLPAGETQKSFAVIEDLINQLIERGVDRGSFLLGIGGGVICDITGFVASIYMRGIDFGFVLFYILRRRQILVTYMEKVILRKCLIIYRFNISYICNITNKLFI